MSYKVSIIIPAFNASSYLNDAIESALNQTYKNIEVLVINDGSTDNGETERIALSYGDRIKYYKKENGGCASALNFGAQKMTGFYFSWLSHDDLYDHRKLEELIALIDEYHLNPERTILGCNDRIMNPQGKISNNLFNNSVGLISPEQAFDETLNKKTINGCGLLIPKCAFEEIGFFRTEYKHLLDREYWMRLAIRGYSYCFAKDPFVISRVHNKQVTVQAQQLLYDEETKLITEYMCIALVLMKKDMLCSLCFFSYKRKHYDLGRRIKKHLADLGWLDTHISITITKYYMRGIIRGVVGKAYKKYIRR